MSPFLEKSRERFAPDSDPDIWASLDMSDPRADLVRPRPHALNIERVLTKDGSYQGRFRWNAFAFRPEVGRDEWTDTEATNLMLDLAGRYAIHAPTRLVEEVVLAVARANAYHPVQQYLEGLPTWDGVERCPDFLGKYWGVADKPLFREISVCWLVSMVARVMEPGCKVDTTPVFIGAQGKGKSTCLKAMLPDASWYSDSEIEWGNKDMYQAFQGIWLYEIAEFDKLRGRDYNRVKAVCSSASDRFRPPYGRGVITSPRQGVMGGTCNTDDILPDPTGSRRFWPFHTGDLDPDGIARVRDALWAEAYYRYMDGRRWHLDRTLAAELADYSEQFADRNVWHDHLVSYLLGRNEVTVGSILQECIGKPPDSWTKSDEMQVSSILRRVGWTHHMAGSTRKRIWRRPVLTAA